MSFNNLQKNIVKKGLCTSCGMCETICPQHCIEMNGLYPEYKDKGSQCIDCNICEKACPGADSMTKEIEKKLYKRSRNENERWLGIISQLLGGFSRDKEIFNNASSGGAGTALLIEAMNYLNLDYVLVAGRDSNKKWIASTLVCRNEEEIKNCEQTTYQIFPHLKVIHKLIEEKEDCKIGIVGLPCQIQAIRKAQNIDGNIGVKFRKNIVFTMELACSTNTMPKGTETLIKSNYDIDLESINYVNYRKGEYPGNVVIGTKDNREYVIPFWKAVNHFVGYKTERCLKCPDWVSGLADISIWDGDPNIYKSSKEKTNEISKHTTIAIRTNLGKEVLESAVNNKAIDVWDKEVNIEDIFGLLRKRNNREKYESENSDVLPKAPI